MTTSGPTGARSPASLLVLGHAALATALFATDGHEGLFGLALVIVAIVAWTVAVRGRMRGEELRVEHATGALWLVALGSTILPLFGLIPNFLPQPGAFIKAPVMYLESSVVPFVVLDLVAALAVASFGLDVLRERELSQGVVLGRRALLFALALAIGAWTLHASPHPKIDLIPVHEQAAQAMLAGKSIYEPGAIHTIETFHNKDVLDAYTYLPFGACLTTVAYALTHEIRWADLVSQLAGALLVWLAARRCTPAAASPRRRAWADLLVAAFLLHPRGAFVLEQGWTEPLAIPFLGGFVVLVLAGRPRLACASLGFFFAVKQHLVLYAPFLLLVPGVGVAGLAIAGAVTLATLVPFAIPSPRNLYRGAFGVLIGNPFRTDALNIPAELARLGYITPTWVGFVAALVPFAWLRRIPRELPWLLMLASLAFSLFYVLGRQAFCNYYYLLDATVLLAAGALSE